VVVDYLAPTNGQGFYAGQAGIDDFMTAVAVKATDACLVADGFPKVPPQFPVPGEGTLQVPNLAFIESHHSFTGAPFKPVDVTKGMSAAEETAYKHAAARCEPKLPTLAVDSSSANAIIGAWDNDGVNAIDTSPAVRAANKAGAQCSKSTAFPATSYVDETRKVGQAALSDDMKGAPAAGAKVEAQGVAVYIRCFKPAIEAVDNFLAARSKSFIAKYAEAIQQIEDRTAKQVASISAKYDVPFASPSTRKRS
jgi:hypothetical protein